MKSLFILLLIFSLSAFATQESPQSFNFQGRLFNFTGTAPLEEMVGLKFQILDASGTCLLYEETQNFDLTNTSGVFAVSVGSATGAAKRTVGTDPGLQMKNIFKNDTTVATRAAASPNCAAGYTPTAGDVRLLRITVTPTSSGTPEVLSPDQTINNVPQALVAETLQGLGPVDFVQKDPVYVTTAAIDMLFGSLLGGVVDATSLHTHDDRYIQIGDSSASDLGSGGLTTTGSIGVGIAPPTAKIHIYSAGGANSGLLTQSTSAASYATTDWKNSSNDLTQMLASGSGFSNGMILSRQANFNTDAPNGISLVAHNAAGFLTFGTGGIATTNERMRITSTGNVGIGTTTPSTLLNLTKNTNGFATNVFTQFFKIGGDTTGYPTGGYNSLDMGIKGVYDAYISTTGNDLHILSGRGVASEDHNIKFYTGFAGGGGQAENNLRMSLMSTGNLGVGVANPTSRLSIADSVGVTGAASTPLVNLDTLWNTTGAPAVIKMNVTNTTSSGASSYIDAGVGGTTRFKVQTDGNTFTDVDNNGVGGISVGYISGITFTGGVGQIAGGSDPALEPGLAHTVAASYRGGHFMKRNGDLTFTSGNVSGVQSYDTFNPTSGTATYRGLAVYPTINQTGGANGITRGLYIFPTLTAAADWRSIDLANTSGYGIYQSSTTPKNYFAGRTGFGSSAAINTPYALDVYALDGNALNVRANNASTTGALLNFLGFAGDGILNIRSSTFVAGAKGGINLEAYTDNKRVSLYVDDADSQKFKLDVNGGSGLNGLPATNVMTITQTGKVGIGTTVPTEKLMLDVDGTGKTLKFSEWAGAGTYSIYGWGIQTQNEIFRLPAHVYFGDSSFYFKKIGHDAELIAFKDLKLGSMSSARTYLFGEESNGYVGINNIVPSYQLDVTGDIRTTGCLYYNASSIGTCVSDRKLKKEISPFTLGLEVVLGLNPVHFKYNGLDGQPNDGKKQLGVIAQDVEKVAPSLVVKKGKYKAVNYGAFTYMFINAFKDMYRKITNTDEELKELKAENIAMKEYLCTKDANAPFCSRKQ
jgi:hypothetical protein